MCLRVLHMNPLFSLISIQQTPASVLILQPREIQALWSQTTSRTDYMMVSFNLFCRDIVLILRSDTSKQTAGGESTEGAPLFFLLFLGRGLTCSRCWSSSPRTCASSPPSAASALSPCDRIGTPRRPGAAATPGCSDGFPPVGVFPQNEGTGTG